MFKELGAMMKLMGNQGKLQEEMQKLQAEIPKIVVEGNSGAGMVTVQVNGKMEILNCKIAEGAHEDREMLEDLIVAATNHALSKAREQLAVKTAEMAANMGLPPGMLGGMGGIPGLG